MSKNNHPIEQEELMAYLDGELATDRAMTAAAHLQRCQECQRLAADLRNISEKLMTWQVTSPDTQTAPDLAAALEKGTPEKNANTPRRRSWRAILSPRLLTWSAAGAAIVLLVAAISMMTFKRTPKTIAQMQVSQHVQQRDEELEESQGVATDGNFVAESHSTSDSPVASKELPSKTARPGLAKSPPKQPSRHDLATAMGPMVIRTANLALITGEFDRARSSIQDILKRHRGYIGNLSVGGPADAGRTLDATLRVPADQLDPALAELKNLGRVESESQKGEEISAQYVDLQARLLNARNTEQRLTDILRERTGRLSDVLEVEEQIDSVRERIEQMDAEKKNLADQVAFATLNVKMTEDYKAQVKMVPPSTSSRIRNAAVDGYETMVGGLISLALLLVSWVPSLLLWGAVLFFPVRSLWKRLRRPRAA
jgi:anti-sigma factor RsiW